MKCVAVKQLCQVLTGGSAGQRTFPMFLYGFVAWRMESASVFLHSKY